jgi:hypothetical protein
MINNNFDEISKNLQRIEDEVSELDGENKVTVTEILNDNFVSQHTDFSTVQEMFDSYDPNLTEGELEELITTDEWNEFICKNTQFDDWEGLILSAGEQYFANKLKNIFG